MTERTFWVYAVLATALVFLGFFAIGFNAGAKKAEDRLYAKMRSERKAYAKAVSARESVIRDYQAKEATLTAELETVKAKLVETLTELGKHLDE